MATTKDTEKYVEGIGRRKEAVARVRLFDAKETSILINDQSLNEFFPTKTLQKIVLAPFEKLELDKKYRITAKVKGGGSNAQAESIRLGISRALVSIDEELRKVLKKNKFLKRDPRVKERKKPGLKKARKAAQWSKR